jgi:hypothetical protein
MTPIQTRLMDTALLTRKEVGTLIVVDSLGLPTTIIWGGDDMLLGDSSQSPLSL